MNKVPLSQRIVVYGFLILGMGISAAWVFMPYFYSGLPGRGWLILERTLLFTGIMALVIVLLLVMLTGLSLIKQALNDPSNSKSNDERENDPSEQRGELQEV